MALELRGAKAIAKKKSTMFRQHPPNVRNLQRKRDEPES